MFKCPVCETVVEVLEACGLELTCCGPAMVEVSDRPGEGTDVHGPVVRWEGKRMTLSTRGRHPMDDDHHIAWMEVTGGGATYRRFFEPGQPAEWTVRVPAEQVTARLYCTLHGLRTFVAERASASVV